ncbi:MAG: glycerophosphodiester phosphodiesterase [Gemmatimonadetes bacterium]|nr:glycerophosphodiester phosphodiesterase [Gemmatimonadota bacterium]
MRLLALAILLATACRATAPALRPMTTRPLIIAHRGASGELPEHTLEAYDRAIERGADIVEPDVVSTKDGVLVARHENEIGGTTDVATKFPARRREAVVDGETVTGWFVEDFTLAELRTLRARERLATRSHANDGKFLVPTLDEVLALVRRRERELGRVIGVYPETKHPTYFRSIGLPLEDRLLAVLAAHGFDGREDEVFIQSFEVGNLKALRARTSIRLIQLVDGGGSAWDQRGAGGRTYAEMLTPEGLREVATYAFGLGPAKALVQPVSRDGALLPPTNLVRDAHAAGLAVHVWTLRADAPYLARAYHGDPLAEWRLFASLGVDGIFGDFPGDGVRALRPSPSP